MNKSFNEDISGKVLLSVVCKTFNQEKYIAQAIESFLMQVTNFEFEILIHDDASTDKTTAIVKDYALRYPHKIKPIIEEKNQFSKGINSHFKNSIPRAQGKYIAICDGDDYWTDPFKLQKQVDFLEANKEYTYVFTKSKNLLPDGTLYSSWENIVDVPAAIDLNYLLTAKFMPPTLSIVFRKNIIEQPIPDFFVNAFHGDWAILVTAAYKGKIGFINDYTCIYREDIGILAKTNKVKSFNRGLLLNKHLNKYTNYAFDYCLGNYEYHYQNITSAYLENLQFISAVYYFFKTIAYSTYKNKIVQLPQINYHFTKRLIKVFSKGVKSKMRKVVRIP